MSVSASLGDLVLAKHPSSVAEASCATMVGATNTSRNRELAVQHKKAMDKATVKEVDVVHRGLRRIETRMHELESRVQYVNPWVVQYMWELLCELRDKIGVRYSHQKERMWIEDMRNGPRNHSASRLAAGSRVNSFSTPHGERTTAAAVIAPGAAATAAAMASVPTTPVCLFEGSADDEVDNLHTSLSSESDDCDDSFFTDRVEGAERKGNGTGVRRGREHCDDGKSNGVRKNCRRQRGRSEQRLEHFVMRIEGRWKCYQLAEEESAARLQLSLDENTYRNLILSRLTCRVANAAEQRHTVTSSLRPSGALVDDELGYRAAQVQARRQSSGTVRKVRGGRDEFSVPSPLRAEFPSGLSPIDPIQSPSEFFSPRTGMGMDMCGGHSSSSLHEGSRKGDRSDVDSAGDCRRRSARRNGSGGGGGDEASVLYRTLLNEHGLMQKLVDDVSQQLAAMIRQSDMNTCRGGSPSQGLPSALMLIIRDAVDTLSRTHEKAFSAKMQDYFTHQQEKRDAQEEQLWSCLAEREDAWTRRAVAEEQKSTELLQEHQRLVSIGKKDAESCSEVRRELVKLCGEVMRSLEKLPDGLPAASQAAGDVAAYRTAENDALRGERIQLHLETLSAAVDGLYADMEAMRAREAVMTAAGAAALPSSKREEDEEEKEENRQWRRRNEEKIATLQESMVDIQNAIGIVARKSREAEERLDSSKAEKAVFLTWEERLRAMEKQLEALPSLFVTPPPLPPPVESVVASGSGDRNSNPMSVEDALMSLQRMLVSQDRRKTGPADPYIKALSALCAALQQVNHLYNIGTGTFGGSLQLIFAMPPFSVPRSLATACRTYLREHSMAELREAMDALGVSVQVAKVLCNCYYWMQSHVLVVSGLEGECMQYAGNDSASISGCRRDAEVPSSHSFAAASLANPSSLPNPGDDVYTPMALQQQNEVTSLPPVTRIAGHDVEVQTEIQEMASSYSLPLPQKKQQSSSSYNNNSHLQLQSVSLASTPLEVLAAGHSLETAEPVHSVVHYYHHHHNCGGDRRGVHPLTPQCFPSEEADTGSQNPELHSGGCGPPMKQYREQVKCVAPLQSEANVSASVGAAAPTISSAISSHMCADRKRELKAERVATAGCEFSHLFPTPSMFDECLPLPTATSPFTDPQEAKCRMGGGGGGSFSLKNPQPFYTASSASRQPQQGPCNNVRVTTTTTTGKSNGVVDGGNMRGGRRVWGGERCNMMHHGPTSPQRHHRLLSTDTSSRIDVLASVMAAQLHPNPSVYRGEKLSSTGMRASTRL